MSNYRFSFFTRASVNSIDRLDGIVAALTMLHGELSLTRCGDYEPLRHPFPPHDLELLSKHWLRSEMGGSIMALGYGGRTFMDAEWYSDVSLPNRLTISIDPELIKRLGVGSLRGTIVGLMEAFQAEQLWSGFSSDYPSWPWREGRWPASWVTGIRGAWKSKQLTT